MKHIVEIEGVKYSLWGNHSPSQFLKEIEDEKRTLDFSKVWGIISEDITLSEENINRIKRKHSSTHIHNFEINDKILITRSHFEIDCDSYPISHEELEYYYENEEEYEPTGTCDGAHYFNKINKEIIIEETDDYILTEYSFYLKYFFKVSSTENRKSLIKMLRSYYDELESDKNINKKIMETWNEN